MHHTAIHNSWTYQHGKLLFLGYSKFSIHGRRERVNQKTFHLNSKNWINLAKIENSFVKLASTNALSWLCNLIKNQSVNGFRIKSWRIIFSFLASNNKCRNTYNYWYGWKNPLCPYFMPWLFKFWMKSLMLDGWFSQKTHFSSENS